MHVKVHHLLVVIHFMRKVSKECTAEGLFWRSLLQALRKPWKQLRQQSAIDVDDVEEDRADAATVAEPEMEVEHRQSEGEPEPDEEMLQDIPEYEEEVTQAMLDERRPLLLPGRAMVTDPDLMQARAAMQPIYCPEMKRGKCIDAKRPAVACMVYYMVYGQSDQEEVDQEKNPQAHVARPALQHILPSDYLNAGQTSIMDQGITQEHRERVARPSNVKGPASASSQGDNRRVTWNANTYVDKAKVTDFEDPEEAFRTRVRNNRPRSRSRTRGSMADSGLERRIQAKHCKAMPLHWLRV
eukprot:s2536_g8.t1